MQICIYNGFEQEKNNISTIIDEVAQNCLFNVSIIRYYNIENIMHDIRDGIFYNAIFIDMNGDELKSANALRKIGYSGEIIFCSKNSVINISSHMIDATGVIVKPYCKQFILELLNNINNKTPKTYQVKHGGTINQLDFDEINFIESRNNKCEIHTINGKIFTEYKKLCEIENKLNDNRFLRSHQSFLVNMNLVSSVSDKFEMKNGEIASITQRNLKKIKTTYKNYIKNKVYYNF